MKYCPNCGAQVPDNAQFCSSCGSRLNAPEPSYQQPEQSRRRFISMDNYRANKAARKQRMASMKWWHWALIAIGVAMITAMKLGA